MSRNSKVILAKNIKLDKNYKSVLKYTESQMIELMLNTNNLVYQSNTCSFIRDENIINVKAEYGTCIQANYVAFQNPDYSNKWFFGFIDNIRYLNNGVCEIHFTTDVFTTWWSYWSPKACFTIREHVTDDTIGLHTVPEGLETGEFLSAEESTSFYNLNANTCVCVGVSDDLLAGNQVRNYNGIYSGLQYIALETETDLDNFIDYYSKKGALESIVTIFMIPESFISDTPIPNWQTLHVQVTVASTVYKYDISCIEVPTSAGEFNLGTTVLSRPSQIGVGNNKYTPNNKKLLTSDYIYILGDNMCGSVAKYDYEYFSNASSCTFQIYGAINPGCSIKIYPKNYKNIENNYSEGLTGAKLPICGWNGDIYTNWLTQNGVNIGLSLLSDSAQFAGGLLNLSSRPLKGMKDIVSSSMDITSTLGQAYSRSLAPRQAQGNTNVGDIMFSIGVYTPRFYQMTIKKEFGEIIDRYFTRMGYKVNLVKVPNMEHRQNYNYVQIGAEENIAYPNNYNNIGIPASALDMINNMFRVGITIWNNHDNFGDYSVSNNIV